MAQRIKSDWLYRLKKLSKPGRLLVFESTGFTLYGALVQCDLWGNLTLEEPAVSRASDFAIAVGEVLEQLRNQAGGNRLPRKAVLITPSATGRLLHLPVDPDKTRPQDQMRDMVRWELEEFFAHQNDIWSPGSILMSRGYISAEQRRKVEAKSGGRSATDYNGIIPREQLDECLDLLEQVTADEELTVGWAPQAGKDEDVRFTWWGIGIGGDIRNRWVEAFRKHGLALAWIYPQFGPATARPATDSEGWLLVEVRQEQFCLFLGRGGRLAAISIKTCPNGLADAEAVSKAAHGLLLNDTTVVYLSAPPNLSATILAELKQNLGREIRLLSPAVEPDSEQCPPEVMISMHGTAHHALGRCPANTLARIQAQPPPPPIWKNKTIYPWLVIFLLLVAIIATETWLRMNTAKNELKLDQLDAEYSQKMRIKQEAQSMSGEVKQLQNKLNTKEAELKEQQRLIGILDNVIRYRQDLVPGILEALGQAINDDVVLDQMTENSDGAGFYLEGWATRDTSAQMFAARLNETLAPYGYKVAETQIARGRGRLAIDGSVLKIWLVSISAQEDAQAAEKQPAEKKPARKRGRK